MNYLKFIKYVNKVNDIVNEFSQIQLGGKNKYIVKLDDYDDYLIFIDKKTKSDPQTKWIYDIIDNPHESYQFLYETGDFILVIENNMEHVDNIDKFHLLAFPKDRSIKSIRDLTADHIDLITTMMSVSKDYINDRYKIPHNEIESHFHYPPGVLLLHMHFELVNNDKLRRPLREHPASEVIRNLKLDSNYYKNATFEILAKSD